jgi:hypothetical protein
MNVEDPGVPNKNVESAKGAYCLGDGAPIVGQGRNIAGNTDNLIAEFGAQLLGAS